MTVYDTYSMQLAREKGEPDVFVYDPVPSKLKVQVVCIMEDLLGDASQSRDGYGFKRYDGLRKALRRQFGRSPLQGKHFTVYDEISHFLLDINRTDWFLDAIDVMIQFSRSVVPSNAVSSAVDEMNIWFRQSRYGFSYENGRFMRMDSEFLHHEAVRPALRLMMYGGYSGAEAEFRHAHDHYLNGKIDEAITEACKSVESVMGSICNKRDWTVKGKRTFGDLAQACFENGLIPRFWQNHIDRLKGLLTAGLPELRNKEGGHGDGAEARVVPSYIGGFGLHMAAASIVFLIEADHVLPAPTPKIHHA